MKNLKRSSSLPNRPYIFHPNIEKLTREQWLSVRASVNGGFRIGGSDCSVVYTPYAGSICCNPWKTKLELYKELRKEPIVLPKEVNQEACDNGHKYEREIAEKFCQQKGFTLVEDNAMYQSVEHLFMMADFDFLVDTPDGRFGLEIKWTDASQWKKLNNIRDGIAPPNYEAQMRHYMAVSGLPGWWLAMGSCQGNVNPDVITDVQSMLLMRDLDEELRLIEAEETFIEDTKIGELPTLTEVDGKDALEALRRVYGKGDPEIPEVFFSRKHEESFRGMLAASSQISDLKAKIKAAESEYDKYAAAIGEMVKEGRRGVFTDETTGETIIFDWKVRESNRFQEKDFQKDHPEMYEEYKKKSFSKSAGITYKK